MENMIENLKPMRIGVVIAVLAILSGYLLGGAFGKFEDSIKDRIHSQAQAVFDTVYKSDAAKMKKVTDKSWSYMKRAHLHANAMGTAALALILLLAFIPMKREIKSAVALCLGLGAFGYGLFWLLAGWTAPAMGSTGDAKEALKFLAVPSAGLSIIGVIATLWFSGKALFSKA